jgi:tyrocidine synthetase-3
MANQKKLWIISQLDNTNPAYNMVLTYHFKIEINLDIFEKSMSLLFNRQHTMFSVFRQKEGEPYIDIIPGPVTVELIDFSGFPVNLRREAILSFAGKDSRRCFDVENGPLYRLYLLKDDETNYYFHATIHHIIFDGWSIRVFVQELSTIYNNLILNADYKPEPLKFHSYNYAQVENRSFSDENEKELIEFWKDNLKGCQPELKFPYDYHRKNDPTGFGFRQSFEISKEYTLKLKELSKNQGSTLFSTMVSLVGVLLQKYSGENDICIGIPVSNRRTHPSLDKIFGLFLNTAVVRLKIETKNKFKDHVNYTKNVVRNTILNSKLPFERIVEVVNPDRISGINPIFQVSLSWLNDMIIPIDFGNIKGERITLADDVTPFDIIFYMWESGDKIQGEIKFNIDILKPETIIRLKENFLTLIRNIFENYDVAIESLPLISDGEKFIIDGFNNTHTAYPKDKTIIQLFEEQVDEFPDKTAVVFKEELLTYKQLNYKANQLALNLMKVGVGRNTPVGILAEKSLDVIVGILGILKAGGVYVPIDPDYPSLRINFIIKDSGCKVLLAQDKCIGICLDGVTKLSLNDAGSDTEEVSNPGNINRSSDLGYIMYTSGTTGNPKGSMICQHSIVRLVRNTNYIDITPEDKILLTSAIVFDASTFEIWGALLNGGSLFMAEKETILNPGALGEALVKNDITILWLTSALFTHLAESGTDIFGNLKYLLVGGDVLSAPHINKVRKANPGLKVINGYGPTENTTFSTAYLIEKDLDHNIPIGRPISNSTCYIFDNNMNYQPIGVIGELYIGGDGLSKGYINRDDLNKKSFIDHPQLPGERLYRTGDYAKWLPDGNIEFHGRIDNQLKIRGFRVELEEIESVISEIDGVIETVIKSVKVEEGDYRLIAFLNVPESFKMGTKEIIKRVRDKLPPYMVPLAYKYMHGFPKTINGKIDRNALIFDLKDLESRKNEEIKTLSQTEYRVFKIWNEVLKTDDFSVTDNFFDIGGNSLLAISVFSKIKSALNVELGLRIFFDNPRIKDLAETIDIYIKNSIENKSVNKENKTDTKIVTGEL